MLHRIHQKLALVCAVGLLCITGARTMADITLPPQVKPALPQIPDTTFNLTDYGAVGDGKTLNTDAFKKALAAIQQAGGGRLVVPKGEFLTLPLNLVSHLEIHLDEGALIQFPKDRTLFEKMEPLAVRPDFVSAMDGGNASMLYGDQLTDIAITGSGTIDGGGESWWGAAGRGGAGRGGTTAPAASAAPAVSGAAAAPTTIPARGPGRGRSLAMTGPIAGRPKILILTSCQRIHLDGVHIQNSPMWQIVPVMCTDVTLENLTVNAPQRSPNTDALNPTSCTNVLIRNCDLSVGDDNIALKALGGPNSNIWIENVRNKFGHGISVGSEIPGGVHDVTVVNCTFDGGDNALRIKSGRDRGNANISNFIFSNITINNVKNALFITMYYSGGRTRQEMPVTPTTPFLKNVQFDNIKITNTPGNGSNAGQILGLPEAPATDVSLTNVSIEADTGFAIQDTKNCVFDNVTIKVQKGAAIIDPYKADLILTNSKITDGAAN